MHQSGRSRDYRISLAPVHKPRVPLKKLVNPQPMMTCIHMAIADILAYYAHPVSGYARGPKDYFGVRLRAPASMTQYRNTLEKLTVPLDPDIHESGKGSDTMGSGMLNSKRLDFGSQVTDNTLKSSLKWSDAIASVADTRAIDDAKRVPDGEYPRIVYVFGLAALFMASAPRSSQLLHRGPPRKAIGAVAGCAVAHCYMCHI